MFPFGWGELWGIADRTDYDLNQHIEDIGRGSFVFRSRHQREVRSLRYRAVARRRKSAACFLCDAYDEEELEGGDVRTVFCICIPALAPYEGCRTSAFKEAFRQGSAKFTTMLSKYVYG